VNHQLLRDHFQTKQFVLVNLVNLCVKQFDKLECNVKVVCGKFSFSKPITWNLRSWLLFWDDFVSVSLFLSRSWFRLNPLLVLVLIQSRPLSDLGLDSYLIHSGLDYITVCCSSVIMEHVNTWFQIPDSKSYLATPK